MKISIREENPQVKKLGVSTLISYLRNSSNATLDMMRLFVGAIRSNGPIVIAQETIGNYAGIRRETANKIIRELHEAGIIIKESLGYWMKCRYYLNPNIEDPEVRWALMDLLPSLALTFSVVTMMPYYSQLPDSQINLNNSGFQYTTSHYIKTVNNIYNSGTKNPLVNIKKSVSVVVTTDDWELPSRLYARNAASKTCFEGTTTTTKVKKERPMESGKRSEYKRADYSRVKGFKLTKAGYIKLKCFPTEALAYGLEKFRAVKREVADPFRYYWSLCRDYCRINGIMVHWAPCEEELRREGLHKDSPGIDIKDVANPFIYMDREKPKNGMYADAVAPQPRVQDTPEEFEVKAKAAYDGMKGNGTFLADLMGDVMAGIAEGAKKRKG